MVAHAQPNSEADREGSFMFLGWWGFAEFNREGCFMFLGWWGFAEFRKTVSMLVTHFCRDLSCDDRYDQH
jgi:hypothetical protein